MKRRRHSSAQVTIKVGGSPGGHAMPKAAPAAAMNIAGMSGLAVVYVSTSTAFRHTTHGIARTVLSAMLARIRRAAYDRPMRLVPLALVAFAACGPSWTDADAKCATDAVHVELAARAACSDDAGLCSPGPIRALERAAYCCNASMLARHGAPVPDGGIACLPR